MPRGAIGERTWNGTIANPSPVIIAFTDGNCFEPLYDTDDQRRCRKLNENVCLSRLRDAFAGRWKFPNTDRYDCKWLWGEALAARSSDIVACGEFPVFCLPAFSLPGYLIPSRSTTQNCFSPVVLFFYHCWQHQLADIMDRSVPGPYEGLPAFFPSNKL